MVLRKKGVYILLTLLMTFLVSTIWGGDKAWATELNYNYGTTGYDSISYEVSGDDLILTYKNFYAGFKTLMNASGDTGTLEGAISITCDSGQKIYGTFTHSDNLQFWVGQKKTEAKTWLWIQVYASDPITLKDGTIIDNQKANYGNGDVFKNVDAIVLGDLAVCIVNGANAQNVNLHLEFTYYGYHTGNYREYYYPTTIDKSMNWTAHNHNSSGYWYDQGDNNNHIKHTYCNEHDNDHSQNANSFTEAHSWNVTQDWKSINDTQHQRKWKCSACGKEKTDTEDHSWDVAQDWHKTNNTTEQKDYKCSACGKTKSETRHVHYYSKDGWEYAGQQRISNGQAQHYGYHWLYCESGDGFRIAANGSPYWEDCYDKDDNGSCDFCGRKRVWVNINVFTPEGNEDTSGGTAKFDVSWYDNLALGATQNHSATQVSDQPYGKVWVGTQIWLSNINMQKSYLYLSGVSGATQSGNQYYYTVQDTSHSIDINTAYKSYALTINPNGGTLNVSDSSITKNSDGTAKVYVTYNHNGYYILGVTASRAHYIMDGFYTAASGGKKLWNNGGNCLNDGTYWKNNKWCYAGDVTVYAHWSDAPGYHNGQAIVYTITYNLFPKNGNGTKITDPGNPTTYTIETPTFTLKNPSATGYDFEGWYGSGTNGSKGVTIVQGSIGDLHFTADWLPAKDTSKSSSKDQNLPYVKTTPIIENNYKLAG